MIPTTLKTLIKEAIVEALTEPSQAVAVEYSVSLLWVDWDTGKPIEGPQGTTRKRLEEKLLSTVRATLASPKRSDNPRGEENEG